MSLPDPASVRRCPRCQAEILVPPSGSAATRHRRGSVGFLILGVLLLGCLLLAYRYKGQIVTVLDLANEATGSTTLSIAALGLAALLAACLAGWLLLPFLITWAYLDLRRRLPRPGGCAEVRPPSEKGSESVGNGDSGDGSPTHPG